MSFERLVGLQVSDEALYANYREAMTPILKTHGGDFRYEFVVSKNLKAETSQEINRLFVIRFPDRESLDRFFANADYLNVRQRYFGPAVTGVTLIAEYQR